jgi:hypothetical protein
LKTHFTLARIILFGLALSLAAALSAQRLQDRQLFLNGKLTNVVILQLNGHSYIDIEALAQITNGSVKFEPTQIALSIPSTNVDANASPRAPGLSKEFASAAIATLAEMKEWKGALGTMLNFGLAVDGSWVQANHERVQTSLTQSTVAATSSADHSALQLLNNQFANLAKWEGVLLAERKDHDGARTVAENSLQNDPVLAKFSSCGRFLSVMLGSGVFTDNPSCD